MQKPYEITKKDQEDLQKMVARAKELKDKFDKDADFIFETQKVEDKKPKT